MEHFVVSARKYRPKTFKDVVGQQSITNTLLNAIDNNHLAQALLFCGPRGVGKTTCARILAKMINQDGTENEDEDFAFNIFELDAASNNSVDDIRNLIDQVRIPPQTGKYKVYIIDEVHMLSASAFNAFLKTLEEPPKHAIFILATTEKHKIIPTILSRCQIFDFKRITVADAREYLKYIAESQGIEAEEDALHIIAQKADGAMRDALSIFDRVVSYSGSHLTRKAVTENLNVLDYQTYMEVTDMLLEGNIPDALIKFNNLLALGFDGHHFISGLSSHFRDLMVCKNEATLELLEVSEDSKQKYLEQSRQTSSSFLMQALDIANRCDFEYRNSHNQRLHVELCLMQLASINADGEKKKSGRYIQPPTHYKLKGNHQSTVQKTLSEQPSVNEAAANDHIEEAPAPHPAAQPKPKPAPVATAVATEPEKPKRLSLDVKKNGVSGLSLSSIRAKKQHELAKKDEEPDTENLPKESFTEEVMQAAWNNYVDTIDKEGKKILSSALASDIPKLKNETTIRIELPNDTMKKEVERDQYPLMEYLKKHLSNYYIELEVDVNEQTEKQYAFTPMEKYQKMREKNPVLDLLRKELDLEI
ncbi:DNA polymerase III subunit gamma/tau [Robertkochia marina]|uniref:DNA polymerase III subunit gamma/tau n=1 Tax=Robertkochia marina TaxID=1227945 RepID=A0A4S3LZ14_9FLAO|nr:DNA polymerase III subunit gamma/tau [Robertkochia marina]THD66676.1 DNA polymerase III subunit gamma/tau [Robertkochia marina]TRZ45486.1 DNA polymerase III subunit gamma/tau [Robertkochia marina]